MTDKLYSRKRIHLPNFKHKKINKIKLFVYICFLIILSIIISFLYAAFPIFKSSCESAAGSFATNITNEAVIKVMQNYTYNDLMNIRKESDGTIKFLEANVVTINQAMAEIVSSIQKSIDQASRTNVYINMGSVSGISVLDAVGPKFDIELETAGRITSKLRTEFDGVGINQTIHKIFMDLDTNIGILTPYGCFKKKFETTVLLTQAIIVGEVPSTYYDFNGSYTNEEDVAMEAM